MDHETMPDWIILQRPGMVPERKGPYADEKWVDAALREMYALYPDCVCIVIRMPDHCYPESGREWLAIYANRLGAECVTDSDGDDREEIAAGDYRYYSTPN